MKKLLCLAPVLLCFLPLFGQSLPENWVLQKEQGTIKSFSRLAQENPVTEFRVTSTVEVPMDTVLRYMWDSSQFENWISKVLKDYKLVAVNPDRSLVLYTVVPTPPFAPKIDVVQQVDRGELRDGSMIIKVHAVPDAYPLQAKMTRIQHFSAIWVIRPVSGQSAEITYRGELNPEVSNIPRNMIDKMAANNAFKMMDALVNFMNEKK